MAHAVVEFNEPVVVLRLTEDEARAVAGTLGAQVASETYCVYDVLANLGYDNGPIFAAAYDAARGRIVGER